MSAVRAPCRPASTSDVQNLAVIVTMLGRLLYQALANGQVVRAVFAGDMVESTPLAGWRTVVPTGGHRISITIAPPTGVAQPPPTLGADTLVAGLGI